MQARYSSSRGLSAIRSRRRVEKVTDVFQAMTIITTPRNRPTD
jgi:hypothetical protein